MVNDVDANPIRIDSTGSVIARKVKVRGILVNADDDGWEIIFNNNRDGVDGGIENFRYASDVVSDGAAYVSLNGAILDGIFVVTLTNIDKALIYLD